MPTCDYVILVARNPELPEAGIWPFDLHDPIPAIPVPLSPGDPDAVLNLKLALDTVYDDSAYGDYLYRRDPFPPLTTEQQVWASPFVPK